MDVDVSRPLVWSVLSVAGSLLCSCTAVVAALLWVAVVYKAH